MKPSARTAQMAPRDSSDPAVGFRRMVEANRTPVAIWTPDGFRYVSPAFEALTGYTVAELNSAGTLALVHPSRKAVDAWMQMPLDEENRVARLEVKLVTKAGQTRLVDVTTSAMEYEGALSIVAVVSDVTDRQAMENDLRASEERYRRFFEDSLGGAVVMTREGRIVECNTEMARMLGFDRPDGLNGRGIGEFVADSSRSRPLIEEVAAHGKLERHEVQLQRADGELVYVLANFAASFDDRGEVVGIRGSVFDVTEMRRLESRLQLAHKVEAIARLAGGIAHDFNNLLTVVCGHSERLLDGLPSASSLRPSAVAIQQAADRATALTRQLLAFSRRQVFDLRVLDVNQLIKDAAPLLTRVLGDAIVLCFDLAEDLPKIKADAAQLEQVLLDLALNARDAMSDGGTLTVRTSTVHVSRPSRERPWLMPGRYVRLEVIDTGVGMDASTVGKLFEPFFTTKRFGKNSGLGLATVYGIVKQSNGYIWVDSEPNRGSTFTIALAALGPEPVEQARTDGFATIGFETVLLVEHDENVRELIANALRRRGYGVLETDRGEHAVQLFAAHLGQVKLLLSDIEPGGLSGPALLERLQLTDARLRVLYISGRAGGPLNGSPVLRPGTPFLQKPFTLQELAAKVREVLDA